MAWRHWSRAESFSEATISRSAPNSWMHARTNSFGASSTAGSWLTSASVQQEIATAISGNLRVRLTSEEKTRLAKSSATNPEAYQLYLKGRYHANQTTAAELKKGIDYFQQAIEKDPSYALAYAGLADAYSALGGGWMYLPPSDSFPEGEGGGNEGAGA